MSLQSHMMPVQSSNVAGLRHDEATGDLHIEFNDGTKGKYSNVSREQYQALFKATSIGGHLHRHIKPHHAWTKL